MKKENLILLLLLLIVLLLGYQSIMLNRFLTTRAQENPVATTETEPQIQAEKKANPYANANLKTEVFSNPDKTFGYQVLLNGSPMIRQPNIPGVPGNAGFRDESKAKKTAELVLLKIRKNIMPPAITTEELDSLGVL